MNEIILKIHSFIDIITNSSTEIYVQASQSTIKSIKTLVNSILSMGESKLTCDDIFSMELISDKEEEDIDEDDDGYNYDDDYYNVSVKVNPLIASEEAKIAAKILGDLTNLFSIEANYNS